MIKMAYNYAASKTIQQHPYKGVRNTPFKGYKTSLRMPCGRAPVTR